MSFTDKFRAPEPIACMDLFRTAYHSLLETLGKHVSRDLLRHFYQNPDVFCPGFLNAIIITTVSRYAINTSEEYRAFAKLLQGIFETSLSRAEAGTTPAFISDANQNYQKGLHDFMQSWEKNKKRFESDIHPVFYEMAANIGYHIGEALAARLSSSTPNYPPEIPHRGR